MKEPIFFYGGMKVYDIKDLPDLARLIIGEKLLHNEVRAVTDRMGVIWVFHSPDGRKALCFYVPDDAPKELV